MARDGPAASTPAIALSIAKIMRQSKDGYNLVKNHQNWDTVLSQLFADEWGMGCVFGLLTGCPLEYQRSQWAKDRRLSKLVSYTKYARFLRYPSWNGLLCERLDTHICRD